MLLDLCAALEYWSKKASSTWSKRSTPLHSHDSSGWKWSACALGPRTPHGAAMLLAGSMMESTMQRSVSQEPPPAAASVASLTQPQSATSDIVAGVVSRVPGSLKLLCWGSHAALASLVFVFVHM